MIRYLAGGKLGDFIHSLSVVNEKFLQTGEKGIVYLSEKDGFTFGVQKAYDDTKEIISKQDYIHSYLLYQGEEYDIDLTLWRDNHYNDFVSRSYPKVMSDLYSVEWGKHKWLTNVPLDPVWADKTIIWTVSYRFPGNINWSRHQNDDIIFISFDKKDYDFFSLFTNIQCPFHQINTFTEMCVILNSCKQFVGSFSSFLAAAFALHTKCFIGEFGPGEVFSAEFEKYLPHSLIHVDLWTQENIYLWHHFSMIAAQLLSS